MTDRVESTGMKVTDHPGKYLRDFLDGAKITVSDASRATGISRPFLNNLLNEHKPLSDDHAYKIAAYIDETREEYDRTALELMLQQARWQFAQDAAKRDAIWEAVASGKPLPTHVPRARKTAQAEPRKATPLDRIGIRSSPSGRSLIFKSEWSMFARYGTVVEDGEDFDVRYAASDARIGRGKITDAWIARDYHDTNISLGMEPIQDINGEIHKVRITQEMLECIETFTGGYDIEIESSIVLDTNEEASYLQSALFENETDLALWEAFLESARNVDDAPNNFTARDV